MPQFLPLPRLSLSGRFEDFPWSFNRVNSGDSWRRSRMYIASASRTADRRNGTRHPHDLKAASPSERRMIRITTSDKRNPTVAVVWIKAVKYPRLLSGECSAM